MTTPDTLATPRQKLDRHRYETLRSDTAGHAEDLNAIGCPNVAPWPVRDLWSHLNTVLRDPELATAAANRVLDIGWRPAPGVYIPNR